MGNIFDLTNGEFIYGNSDSNSFMSQDGHLMSRMSENAMIDLETGELHLTSSTGYDDYNNKMFGRNNDDDGFSIF